MTFHAKVNDPKEWLFKAIPQEWLYYTLLFCFVFFPSLPIVLSRCSMHAHLSVELEITDKPLHIYAMLWNKRTSEINVKYYKLIDQLITLQLICVLNAHIAQRLNDADFFLSSKSAINRYISFQLDFSFDFPKIIPMGRIDFMHDMTVQNCSPPNNNTCIVYILILHSVLKSIYNRRYMERTPMKRAPKFGLKINRLRLMILKKLQCICSFFVSNWF